MQYIAVSFGLPNNSAIMFGNLNIEKHRKVLDAKLASMVVTADAGNGAIVVRANAKCEILDIKIDKSKLDWNDSEVVQDLLVVALNRTLSLALEKQQEIAKEAFNDFLPGFQNLFT